MGAYSLARISTLQCEYPCQRVCPKSTLSPKLEILSVLVGGRGEIPKIRDLETKPITILSVYTICLSILCIEDGSLTNLCICIKRARYRKGASASRRPRGNSEDQRSGDEPLPYSPGPNGLTEMLEPLKAARQAATKCTTPPAEVTHYIAF